MVAIAYCLNCAAATAQTSLAFPTAEGFGANATGGRGGTVYHVTNLSDSGPGSLRYGADYASGPTTIVFDVGGTIRLQSTLFINNSNLTIAGQTAPGMGIEVVGNSVSISGSNEVVRYMRFRAGDSEASAQDSLSVSGGSNVIVDHVSASWGMDESLSVTLANNVSVQNSIIAETLNPNGHSDGSLVRGNVSATTPGGYTFSHNLWISNDIRNPGIGSRQTGGGMGSTNAQLNLDLVNNVIYNWGRQAVHTVESNDNMYLNMVNNMFIAGPSTTSPNEVFREEPEQSSVFGYTGRVYIYDSGNMIDSNKDAAIDPVAVDHTMFKKGLASWPINYMTTPYPYPTVTTQSAQDAYQRVLATAGASLQRDSVDTRLISEVTTQGGAIITSQDQVGGYPILATTTRAANWDSDGDGMPDSWEIGHGSNPYRDLDGAALTSNGYTNLENYLNNITGDAINPPGPTNILCSSGSKTWDAGTTKTWSSTSGGPYSQSVWAAGNDAVFEGTPGTVTVSGSIAGVNSLVFNAAGYTLAGTGVVTLTGSGGYVTTVPGTTTVNCVIAGSVGLTKGGPGTLVLGGANTFTGTTTIAGGILTMANATALSTSTLDYSNYGGSLSFGSLTAATLGALQGNQNLALTNDSGQNVAMTVGGNNATTSYYGILSGGGSLTKVGSGTLYLGASSYTGLTKVSGGTLVLSDTNALSGSTLDYNSYGGTVNFGSLTSATLGGLQGNQSLALTNVYSQGVSLTAGGNGANTTYGGVLYGAGALIKTGSGTLILTGASTYSGGTTISDGTLQIGNGSTNGSITGDVTDNATLICNRTNAFTLSGNITGRGILVKAGSGSLTLSGSNTFTGLTKITGGTLTLGSNNALSGSTLDYNSYGGTLSFGSRTSVAFGGIQGNQNLALTNASSQNVALTIGGNNATTSYGGVLSGGGSLTKTGSGTLVLTGSNTYSGGTTLSAGMLQIGSGGSTGSIAGNVANNAALVFNRSDSLTFSGNITSTGSLTQAGSGTLVLTGTNSYSGGTTINAGTLQVGNGATAGTIAGNVTNNAALVFNRSDAVTFSGNIAGAGNLTQAGSGSLTLGGSNSYTGLTKVAAGTLILGNSNALSGSTLDYNNYGGTLSFGTLTTATLGSIQGNQNLALTNTSSQNVALTVGGNGGSTAYSGSLTGGGSLNKIGFGILTLTGTNAYNGGTTITNGTLQIGNGGTTGSITGDVTNNAAATFNRSNTLTFAGNITGTGSLTQAGTGTLILTGANAYSGGTTIAAGTLQLGDGATNGSLTGAIVNNASFVVNNVGDQTYSNDISGTGRVIIGSTGVQTFTGNLTYQGGTTVNSGATLKLSSTAGSGTSGGSMNASIGDVTVNGTLDTGGSATQYVNALNGSGSIVNTVGGITNLFVGTNNGDGVFNGDIANQNGAAYQVNVTKVGTGAITLGGSNDNAFMELHVQQGTVVAAKASAVGLHTASSITGIDSGAVLQQQGTGDLQVYEGGTVTLTGGTYDLGGKNWGNADLSGASLVVGTSTGATTSTIANSSSAAVILNPTSIALNNNLALDAKGNIQLLASASGSGSLTKTGSGALILTGDVAPAGGVLVTQGTLQIGNGGTTGSITSDVSNNSAMVFNRSDSLTFAGNITGNGTLAQSGSGTLILTGNNNYSGGTTIASGTLQVGNGGTAGSITGNLNNKSTLAFNRSDTVSFAGNITGSGTLNQLGAGALTLTGTNDYGGLTTVMAGSTLVLGLGAQDPVLNRGGADIQSTGSTVGTLVLDFAGGADPTAAVRNDLLSGLIHDSTLGTRVPGSTLVTLGYFESGTLLTIKPVLAGDANGDGAVDGADFTILRSNWGATSEATWATGDFNYDGTVDGADFTAMVTNWGSPWPPPVLIPSLSVAPLATVFASQDVPEPSAAVMLVALSASGALWCARRRWPRARIS
jgi:autotransporter-associated beta strand protein